MPSGIYLRSNGTTGTPSTKKTCIVCGKEFRSYASLSRVKTCSKKCGYEAKKRRYERNKKCENCGNDFTVRAKHYEQRYCSVTCRNRMTNWKKSNYAEWKQTPQGYIATTIRGQTIMQHRVVMEQFLGRALRDYENVHHRNGVRTDNSIENLELWVRRQPYGQRSEETIEWAVAFLRSHGYTVTAPSSLPT